MSSCPKWFAIVLTSLSIFSIAGCTPNRLLTQLRPGQASVNKLAELDTKVRAGSQLSETDVDWFLSLAGNLPKNNVPNFDQRRAIDIADVFREASLNQLPETRLPKIFGFASTMASSTGPHTLPIYVWTGCDILGNLKNKKAVPVLKRCLASNNSDVRASAAKAMSKIVGVQ